jgi:plasmid stability protein
MATLTIKNIPDELYEQLKASAAVNRRSINNEVLILIERAVRSSRPSSREIAAQARELRKLTAHHHLTEEKLEEWKNQGRP